LANHAVKDDASMEQRREPAQLCIQPAPSMGQNDGHIHDIAPDAEIVSAADFAYQYLANTFATLMLAKAYPWRSAIIVNEFDPRRLHRP